MNILKNSLAPISDQAWEEIFQEAKLVIETVLCGRKFVDMEGPKGLTYGAVPLGKIDLQKDMDSENVGFGISRVLPLVETRIPFELDLWELDNISRGAQDPDFESLGKAARKIAQFEEDTVFYGLKSAHIKGLRDASAYKVQNDPDSVETFMTRLAGGIADMKNNAVEGPYHLIVNPKKWAKLLGTTKGYPLKRQIEDILNESILFSPVVRDIFLVSKQSGNFILTLGSDMSIGYTSHDNHKVRLYFTESFTFQILNPAAVMVFK